MDEHTDLTADGFSFFHGMSGQNRCEFFLMGVPVMNFHRYWRERGSTPVDGSL
jgi:hypothetical protein